MGPLWLLVGALAAVLLFRRREAAPAPAEAPRGSEELEEEELALEDAAGATISGGEDTGVLPISGDVGEREELEPEEVEDARAEDGAQLEELRPEELERAPSPEPEAAP